MMTSLAGPLLRATQVMVYIMTLEEERGTRGTVGHVEGFGGTPTALPWGIAHMWGPG